jgi:hydroxylaminobenzene mutase
VNIVISQQGKKLIFWGALLFLIGLMQGALIPYFTNPRMALSAHLTAVQSGMAVIIFGLLWELLSVPEKWKNLAYYANIVGMYLVWFAITLAAIVGASRALPIAGSGYSSSNINETLVEIIVMAGSGFIVLSTVIIVFGLYKRLLSNA